MCGICGFVSQQAISLDQLKDMNDMMTHRGPDDSGEEIYPLSGGFHLGLAQRRLAILDLSASGHQPMHAPGQAVSVVFNGEIYNFAALKEELSDYPFRSHCDTEVIIAAYLKWGIECVHKFNGMFAIALWDRTKGDFFLIRDRIGKKPLYYQWEKGNLYFGSELKPLMVRPGFVRSIRKEIMSRYLYQQYIAHPDSIFDGVYKLAPGAVLYYHFEATDRPMPVRAAERDSIVADPGFDGAGGTAWIWKYWEVKKVYHRMRLDPVDDYLQAKSELKELLKRSVATRMIADVPVGAFLSGGYDSSLITAMAAEGSSTAVRTFSIGFNEEGYNEAKYARAVSEYLGTSHTELYISEREMYDLVDSISTYYDEPFADSSQIPTMLVAELAKKDVTVALSGDGGDEFFCGYNIYENVRQAQMLDLPGGIIHAIGRLPGMDHLRFNDRLPFRVRVVADNRDRETKVQFGAGSYIQMARAMVATDEKSMTPCNYPVETTYRVNNWQIRRMLLDMDTYLPADILCKVDRASMKYSLEARCPILDPEVMEYSFRLAHRFKFDHNEKKRILKDIAYDYVPRSLLDRPKVGFGVPLDKWLRGPLREELSGMCERGFLRRQGLFDSEVTAKMIERFLVKGDGGPSTGANFSKLTWSFFTFQKWYQSYFG
ncbi:MAG: asparagine synthase (glutamine-hydrolyzing) [Lachnospiraceae bacterium]|jgi:asparagine synthase (glutamine-hydrolysing)|nr:asparagine synthase (glutamine-hydrolyzing) [Lachnospiraceae bacterium]